jgi:hypothetical protein
MEEIKLQKQKKPVGIWIMLVALIMALGAIGWLLWMLMNCNTQHTKHEADKKALEAQVAALQAQLAAGGSGGVCNPMVTDALKTTIRSAVDTQDYTLLIPHMTSSVNVILAASEGVGPRTPEQAVEDMAYLNEGTSPWDFALPAATIAAWEAGFYADYFDENTFTGRASNGMVVVFDFNDCGKMSEVFMAANEELLAS